MARLGEYKDGEIIAAREGLARLLADIIPADYVPEFLGRLETLIEAKIKLDANPRY